MTGNYCPPRIESFGSNVSLLNHSLNPRLLTSFSVYYCTSFSIGFGWNHKPLPSLVHKNNRRNCCSRILSLVQDQLYRSHVHPVWSSTLRLASHYPVYTWCSASLGIINRKRLFLVIFSPTFAVFHPHLAESRVWWRGDSTAGPRGATKLSICQNIHF